MKETRLADPAFFFDKDAVHDRDLSRRAAETQGRDPQPNPKRLAE
jgi:hypothetical protein